MGSKGAPISLETSWVLTTQPHESESFHSKPRYCPLPLCKSTGPPGLAEAGENCFTVATLKSRLWPGRGNEDGLAQCWLGRGADPQFKQSAIATPNSHRSTPP